MCSTTLNIFSLLIKSTAGYKITAINLMLQCLFVPYFVALLGHFSCGYDLIYSAKLLAAANKVTNSPFLYKSIMMSQPPTNSALIYN